VTNIDKPSRILCVVGARPNFMKIAPIMRAFNHPSLNLSACLLHTGQHYDEAMKKSFFDQLQIPEPDIDRGVGSGTHTMQTAEIMKRFEPVLDEVQPKAILVVGDVNSTIACALVAVKKNIPIIHVESGLRSGDRTMPEEINRVLTDQISDLLFTTEKKAELNLIKEGIEPKRIHFTGNVMIDTLMFNLDQAVPAVNTLEKFCASQQNPKKIPDISNGYGLVTMHRPSNVDDPAVLEKLLNVLAQVGKKLPLIFPIHPRTQNTIIEAGLGSLINGPEFFCLPPLGYLDMLGMMKGAKLVLTDSGGLQEETTALGVPCITLRESTERPITAEEGTNTIVGNDSEKILACVSRTLETGGKSGMVPELWDGKAAERIAKIISDWVKTLS